MRAAAAAAATAAAAAAAAEEEEEPTDRLLWLPVMERLDSNDELLLPIRSIESIRNISSCSE